jgi:hypothetical protein
MKPSYKYLLLLSLLMLAKSGIAADSAPSNAENAAIVIKAQAASTPMAAKPGEPKYLGNYEVMVHDLKEVYSVAAESAGELSSDADGRIPIIAIENWTAGYVVVLYRNRPDYQEAFKLMLADTLGASQAIQEDQQPTNAQFTAARAIRELAGNSSVEVTRFMKLLVDANYMIAQEDEIARTPR